MKRVRGFSLVELMVVLVIAAVLAGIALPAYTHYLERSRRTAAIQGLLEIASRQARYYASTNAYADKLSTLGYASDSVAVPSADAPYYLLSIASMTPAAGEEAAHFSLQAVPQGSQARDSCGSLGYSDLGLRSASADSVAACWAS